MSIKEMISEHPQVGADYNDQLGEAIKHAMYGAAIMNSCADACTFEMQDKGQDRTSCIRRCLDASDACTAFYRIASRRTAGNVTVIKSLAEAVIIACKVCAEECAMHTDAHCQRCERMCREVVEDVMKARDGMMDAA